MGGRIISFQRNFMLGLSTKSAGLPMDLKHLEHFVAVAEERNFTRAAQRLHIVQSGLSASIRALEQELGTALFIRTTRRVDPTPTGLAFLIEARRVLAAAADARLVVDQMQGLQRDRKSVV